MKKEIRFSLLLAMLPVVVLFSGCAERKQSPQATLGVLDLSEWDFEGNGPVALNGEWEIYWQRLLTPDDFSGPALLEPTGFIAIPKLWEGYRVDGIRLSHQGHATLRLKFRLPVDHIPLVIQIDTGKGARKIWMDNELLTAVGEMGTSEETVRGSIGAPVMQVVGTADQTRVLFVQIANYNYHHFFSSFFKISIGKYEDLQIKNTTRASIDIFILGALFFTGFYHAILYFFRKKERSNLYFSAICLLYGSWSTVNGLGYQKWKTVLMNGDAWLNVAYITDSSFYFLLPALIMYVHTIFPRECPRVAVRLSLAAGTIWFTVKILVHYLYDVRAFEILFRAMFHYTWRPFLLIFIAFAFYIIGIVIMASVRNRPNALFVLASLILLLACGVHDILQVVYFHNTARLFGFGFFSMIICQSFILAGHFSRSFKEVERLSLELGEKNIALSRMDKLKDEFLSNTSHELRTPLSGIIGISESLVEGAAGRLSQKTRQNLEIIISSGRRLAKLVNDILDFSKLRNQDIKLKVQAVDIRSLVDGVLAISAHLAKGKVLKLDNAIPTDTPYVAADEDRLYQIMFNLIGNAIKFTDKGRIRVSADHTGSWLTVTVSDTGIGIPQEKINSIFKAFQKVDAGDSRAFGGTGLGLGISQHLVKLHGGEISVESAPDRGSQFSFTLPVSTGETQSIEHHPEISTIKSDVVQYMPLKETSPIAEIQEGFQKQGEEGVQVLIVDDDLVNLSVAANYLKLVGISSRCISSGFDALDLIDSGFRMDLVLLDIMMPKMNGYDVCAKLRERFTLSDLPIIMLTAKNRTSDLEKGFAMGANDYLVKPYSREELISRVRVHLDIKAAYQTLKEKKILEIEVEHLKCREERALHSAEKEAFEKLRYQLNPHFLFNALAAIRGAVTRDPEVAHNMVTHLAEFTRMALSRGTVDRLTIEREMELIGHYLAMEQIRFGDFLEVVFDIQDDALDVEIPAMVMQPLVENAFKYGSRTSPDMLEVYISVNRNDADTVEITIANSGAWVEPENVDTHRSTGTGLNNVKQRLESYYKDAYGFHIYTDKGRVAVVLTLPIDMPKSGETKG